MQSVDESAGAGQRMGPGTIYGSLQRMAEAGLVRELDAADGNRRRLFACFLRAGARLRLKRGGCGGSLRWSRPGASCQERHERVGTIACRERCTAVCCAPTRASSAVTFRADLGADFAEMLSTLGRRAAWRRVCGDWLQSVSSTRIIRAPKRVALARLPTEGSLK